MRSVSFQKNHVYVFFCIIYFTSCLYCIFNIEWVTDNLNYRTIYDDILNNPWPFHVEFLLSSLMYFFKLIGLDYQEFLIVKHLLWLPAVLYIDYRIGHKRYSALFSLILVVAFCYPGFISSMIFLSRQSLSTMLILLAFSVKRRRWLFMCTFLAVVSHLSALLYILLFSKRACHLINSTGFKLIIFAMAILSFLSFGFASGFVYFLANYMPIPDALAYNLNAKIGYHLLGLDSTIQNSKIVEVAMIFIIILDVVFSSSTKPVRCESYVEQQIVIDRITGMFYLSLFFYFFLHANPILANRVGFVSYFMIAPYLAIFLCTRFRRLILLFSRRLNVRKEAFHVYRSFEKDGL